MDNISHFNRAAGAGVQARFDEGLRRYMLGIYRNMGIGLAITALVALGVAATPPLAALIFGTPLKWVAMFAPLAFVFFFSFRIERMSVAGARTAFFAFAAVMGVSMASIFLVFTATSIASAFFAAAAMFAGLSLWGYTTKRDLTGLGSFLMIGLLAVIGVSLVNIFLGSSMLQILVSIVGVAVFAGLTAWDTQRLKSEYIAYAGTQAAEKLAVMGALSLYLNLINLFQLLLGLMGQREGLIVTGFTCPVDGATLVPIERQGIEIDHCPSCRGVWLDRGELDKIVERSAAPAPRDTYREPERRYDDQRGYPPKRKRSFLEDLFD